eukprot:scaffold63435_cov26-Tisochrysis_lutea.AAC.2
MSDDVDVGLSFSRAVSQSCFSCCLFRQTRRTINMRATTATIEMGTTMATMIVAVVDKITPIDAGIGGGGGVE